MKKHIAFLLAAALLLFVATPSYAIEEPNPQGTITLGVQLGPLMDIDTYGLGLYDFGDYFNYDNLKHGFMLGFAPAITADYVLVDSWWKGHFSIGLVLGAGWNSAIFQEKSWRYKESIYYVAPRVLYGINLSPKFEVHAGFATGVNFHLDNRGIDDQYGYPVILDKMHFQRAGFEFDFTMGGRFNFTENLSLTADLNFVGHMPGLGIGMAFTF